MDNVCIGTAQFGMNYGIANRTGQPHRDVVRRIIQQATENRIFFYDTAASYGDSEQLLGDIFADLKISNQVKVITKISPDFNFSNTDRLEEDVSKSLKRLGIESLWGLMLHRTEIEGDWEKILAAVTALKDNGMIQKFGVSVYHPDDALSFAMHPAFDMVQVPFNVLDRRLLDNDFFLIAEKNDKHVFIRSIFLQGLLLLDKQTLQNKNMAWASEYIGYLNRYIQAHKMSAKAFMLNAVMEAIPWAKLVIGLETPEQLAENLSLLNGNNVTKETIYNWWCGLPLYPEKLLNPSLWEV